MALPGEWTAARVGALLSGAGPTLLRRMSAGLAVLDEEHGCCVLVTDDPHVGQLRDLPRERRRHFLDDLDRLGEAVHNVCARRPGGSGWVDLHIHGRPDGVLHAHVRPIHRGDGQARALVREQLIEELESIEAAARAEYAPNHVYGPGFAEGRLRDPRSE
jgi:diadenosine tetraphosphate (Ap4A) HIT family hydrolase